MPFQVLYHNVFHFLKDSYLKIPCGCGALFDDVSFFVCLFFIL